LSKKSPKGKQSDQQQQPQQQKKEQQLQQQKEQQIQQQTQQLNATLRRLKEQLATAEQKLRRCSECYDNLLVAKKQLEDVLGEAYSAVQYRLANTDTKIKILRRSFGNIQTKLKDPRVSAAVEELSAEARKLLGTIDKLQDDIAWLRAEISRKERELMLLKMN